MNSRNRYSQRPRPRFRPLLEALEDRALPAPITVTSLLDPIDAGEITLRDAITMANTSVGVPDTIVFANTLTLPGTITLTAVLAITDDLTIKGPGANLITVSGNNLFQVFTVGTGDTVKIEKLTMTKGAAVSGGAIDNAGNLTLNDCVLIDNTATDDDDDAGDEGDGGGAILNQVGATLSILKSELTSNRAIAFAGDDVFGGAPLNKGTATITSSIFTNNQALEGGAASFWGGSAGGAISNYDGGTLTVSKSSFTSNQAVPAAGTFFGMGGAIENNAGPAQLNPSNATITKCTFVSNQATGGTGGTANGGALDNQGDGSVMNVSKSQFTGNKAIGASGTTDWGEALGGAIINAFTAVLSVDKSTFAGNVAKGGDETTVTPVTGWPTAGWGFGGAILNGLAEATITKSTFVGNQALGGNDTVALGGDAGGASGGAVYTFADFTFDAELTVSGSTFTGNSAVSGTGANPEFAAGGAIGVRSEDGTVTATITKSTFKENVALGGNGSSGNNGGDGVGGAIAVGIGALITPFDPDTSTLTATKCVFTSNLAQGGAGAGDGGDGVGGGIALFDGSSVEVNGGSIKRNSAIGGSGSPVGAGIGGGVFDDGTFNNLAAIIAENFASTSDPDIGP